MAKESLIRWQPMSYVGLDCKDRLFRVCKPFTTSVLSATDVTEMLAPGHGRKVYFPVGAIGRCYAAYVATLYVGFLRDMTQVPQKGIPATRCEYHIRFGVDEMDYFVIEG